MEKTALAYLEKLTQTPSPSGFEQPLQKVIKERVGSYVQSIEVDVHGNIISGINTANKPRVMLCGHCDEIGFMITHISDDGYLYISPIGGIDIMLLPGLRVLVHTAKGPLLGVIGKKPIHLMSADDKHKKVDWNEFWIDIGAKNGKEAKAEVEVGNAVTFEGKFSLLKNNKVVSRGFDDKIGTFIVTELMTRLDPKKLKCGVYAVATVQEEIGLRGAKTSASRINPDIGIAVDIGFSADFPEGDKRGIGDIKLGKGPMLYRGPNINPVLGLMIEKIAKKMKIPFQICASPRATGTDANVVQLNNQGVATALIGIPTRYGHSPVEVVSLDDAENTIKLLKLLLESLEPGESFIPR